jgi:hypothetical protein
MPTGDNYDVSELLDPTVDANKITHAQAKRWAELAYIHGQWSRDEEIVRLRDAYVKALSEATEYRERIDMVLAAYQKIKDREGKL